MNRFAEYEILSSRSGAPTALHVPSQTLVHSGIDPRREAGEIADAHNCSGTGSTLLIGGGLGYLAEAILQMRGSGHRIHVIEPDAGLLRLAMTNRSGVDYLTSSRIHVSTVSTKKALQMRMASIEPDATVIISPYLLRLSECNATPLKDILRVLRTEIASSAIYAPLLRENSQCMRVRLIPAVENLAFEPDKMMVIVGAGPSLDHSLEFLRQHRSRLNILAASGAAPALMAGGVAPDCVFAMEAKVTVVSDLSVLPQGARVVIFPFTHPAVIASGRYSLYSGGDNDHTGLETRGGSSAIPALDYALRASTTDLLLVGMDLGYQSGTYAHASKRATSADVIGNPLPPKFLAMRAGLERVLSEHGNTARRIYHVLTNGVPLKGTTLLSPERLADTLSPIYRCEVESD
jgi:hypothetical protein